MQAHHASSQVMNPKLQVLQVPKTDASVQGVQFTQLRPVTTGINPMEFLIPATDAFLDLNRSYFEMEVRLKTSANANLAHNTVLYPVTNLAHTLIKQLSVYVNGVLLEPQTDHYHYRALFQTLLNNNRQDGETILTPQGWYNDLDTPSVLTDHTIDSAHNDYKVLTGYQQQNVQAMKNAMYPLVGGKFQTLFFTPHSPLFHTGKLMVPQQEVSIKMYFNDPALYLVGPSDSDANATKGKALTQDDVKLTLNLCQVTVQPSLYREITTARGHHAALYPLVASKIRTFSMANGLTDFDQDQLFTNRVPVRVIVVLLHNDAFNGNNRRSPYCFEKFGLTIIRMTINGEEYPYKNALELTHNDGSKDMHGYRRLLEATAAYQRGEPSMLLPDMWGQNAPKVNHDNGPVIYPSGNVTLFTFNFTPDGLPDASTFHPPQSGNVRLQFKLNASPGHAVTVMLYAEFENVMEIDQNGGVLYNDDSLSMELVPTTDQQLRYLGRHHPQLQYDFAGVFASDQLPSRPVRDRPQGYIVNVDPHDRPGSHWIALWTDEEGDCTVMDSFGLPLHLYQPPNLYHWVMDQFDRFQCNRHALQAVDSQACGLYALYFLVHMSVGGTLDTFLDLFSRYDFVKNDRCVVQWGRRLVECAWNPYYAQANYQPVRLAE